MITIFKKISLIILVGMGIFIPMIKVSAIITEPGFEVQLITNGLTLPTSMAFAPDGRIFIAEKGGTVRVVKDGALLSEPLITLTNINTYGDRGLIGIATDPDFLSNGYIYLSYTHENTPGSNFSGAKTGRIVRVTVVGDTASETTKVVLVGSVGGNQTKPSCEDFAITDDCIPSDSPSHSVGGLRFGPDGMLYATLGEGANFDYADPLSLRAQNIDSLAGKLLRINTDGSAPADNPFYNGDPSANRSKIYALGLRNAFRLNFHAGTGALYLGDVGWSSWEEINLVTPGANFGWPCWEGMEQTTHNCAAPNTAPLYYYPHDSSFAGSITVGAFPSNGAYPTEYDSSFFFGDYAQNWIKRLVLDSNGEVISVQDFMDNPDGPVDISMGPDGSIYYISIYTGSLNHLTHTLGNRSPVPEVSAEPTAGLLPLDIYFSSTGSYDPDGDSLVYLWNFGDGFVSNQTDPVHTYNTAGTYTAVLTLTDDKGAQSSKSIVITAGNQVPQATILSPANGALYKSYDMVQLNGDAIDLEDGILGDSAFNWQIILHHNTHIHFIQEFIGIRNPIFIAPDHTGLDIYTEIILTVTDSAGLIGEARINMYLDTAVTTGNLIGNPSVEIDSGAIPPRPENWERGGWGNNTRIYSYPVPGFDGVDALQTEITDYTNGDAKWYFLPVNVTPLETYIYSDYYTSDVPTTYTAQFGFPDGTYQYKYLGTVAPATTPTFGERSILIPAGTQTLTVFHSLQSIGTLITDNFSLLLYSSSASDNLILNGFFETENGANPLGWTPITAPGTTAVFDYPVIGVDGNKAVQIEITNIGPDGNARWQFADVPVSTGVEYTYEEYYKASTIHDIIGRYTFQDGSEHFFGLNKEIPPAVDWTLLTGKFVAPENIASVTLMSMISTNATLSLDNTKMYASGTGTPAELIPPVVSFISPIDGAVVSGVITLLADAIDNVGVAGLFFAVDGTPLGSEMLAPFTFDFDTRTVSNGAHILKATARDDVGNNSFSAITITVDNSPPEGEIQNPSLEQVGTTGDPENWFRGGWGVNDRAFTYPVVGIDGANAGKVEITTYTNGDAKWYFADVPVSPGDQYTFSHQYKSTIATNVIVRYTLSSGSFQYQSLGTLPLSSSWQLSSYDISIPVDAQSMTVFHVLDSVGALEIDDYKLVKNVPQSNLIINPSLESIDVNGNPQNWMQGYWGNSTTNFIFPVPGIAGANGARIDMSNYVDGDAKWYFDEVSVESGKTYTISHSYRSDVPTDLTVRYTLADGSVQYEGIALLPATATWAESTETFIPPSGALSITIFHAILANGWLEVDDYNLVLGNLYSFNNGMLSLTFDDGWESQYSVALPILNASALKGGFYIITEETLNAQIGEEISNPSFETVASSGDPENWFRGGWGVNDRAFTYPVVGIDGANAGKVEITTYTNGDAKWYFGDVFVTPGTSYILSHSYNSTTMSRVVIRYTKIDNTVIYLPLATLASTNGIWASFQQTIVVPADVASITVFHLIDSIGSLITDDYSLKKAVQTYVDPAQVLEIQLAGHEVGAHTRTHPSLTSILPAQAQAEIEGSRTDLEAMGILNTDTFVYPYGDYDENVQTQVKNAGFSLARGVDRGFNTKITDPYALKIQAVYRTTTLTEIENWIAQANIDNTWLILMFHQIDDIDENIYGTTPSILQQIVDYINSTNTEVVTMKEALLKMSL